MLTKINNCQICGQNNKVHSLKYLDIKNDKLANKDICDSCSEKLANDDLPTIAKMWEVSEKVAKKQLIKV